MKRNDSLFIGQSPLQALNLAEAYFKFGNRGVFYIVYDKDEIKKQASDILETLGIEDVAFQRRSIMFRIFFPFYITLFYIITLLRHGRPKIVFYGTYTSWASFLINIISPEKTVLIGDGQKTINIITQPKLVGLRKKYIPSPFSRSYVYRSVFFTYYDRLAEDYGLSTTRNSL